MKSKLGFAAFAAIMAASLCVFAGCSNDVQDVSIQYSKANPVAAVTVKAEKLTDTTASPNKTYNYVFVSWDAVDNVSYYDVYLQQEGKKTISEVNNLYEGSGRVFDSASTNYDNPVKETTADAPDVDKRIGYGQYSTVEVGSDPVMQNDFINGQKYRFGVQTRALVNTGNNIESDIVWSEYIQF